MYFPKNRGRKESPDGERLLGEDTATATAHPEERAAATERAVAAERAAAAERDVIACLRSLGFRADESRRAAALSAHLAGATLEERVRLALSCFRPRAYTHTPAAAAVSTTSSLGRAP